MLSWGSAGLGPAKPAIVAAANSVAFGRQVKDMNILHISAPTD
jgi:hypothetical protein